MLLDGTRVKYEDFLLPCSDEVLNRLIALDEEMERAFSKGYEAVAALPRTTLFYWMAKTVYGILFHDFQLAIQHQSKRQDRFTLSNYLKRRFSTLHGMMQGMLGMVDIANIPFSMAVFKVRYSKDVFNYRDETNNLNCSLSMNDFGIVACLQDHGINESMQKVLIEKIGSTTLHPAQFEEICSRFIYSNYLLRSYPTYEYVEQNKKVVLELSEANWPPGFQPWNDEMFAQVLATYWKPWGIPMSQIHQPPNPPISFLYKETSEDLVAFEEIALPY